MTKWREWVGCWVRVMLLSSNRKVNPYVEGFVKKVEGGMVVFDTKHGLVRWPEHCLAKV